MLLGLPESLLKLATWAVASFEIVGPLALLAPVKKGWLRLCAVIGFIGLHAVFLLTLFIGIFPLIGIISMFFFLPPIFWESFGRVFSTRPLVKIYYDQDCGFCLRMVRLIETFFLPHVQFAAPQTVPPIAAAIRQPASM